MEKKEFKKALTTVLSDYGFVLKGNTYCLETNELIIVVATQKSNYDNSYYINLGFLIKSINPDIKKPKDNKCDVFGRFSILLNNVTNNNVYFEAITFEDFCNAFRESVDERIKPVIEFGIRKYFELNPAEINTATLKIKQYLNL